MGIDNYRTPEISRRRFLRLTGAIASVTALLTACGLALRSFD